MEYSPKIDIKTGLRGVGRFITRITGLPEKGYHSNHPNPEEEQAITERYEDRLKRLEAGGEALPPESEYMQSVEWWEEHRQQFRDASFPKEVRFKRGV